MRLLHQRDIITPETILTGIICNRCGNELPPHTAAELLDADHPVHQCPHTDSMSDYTVAHDYLLDHEGEDE